MAASQVDIQPGEIILNGAEKAMADCIQDLYKPIMDTAWNYPSGDDMKLLKEKSRSQKVEEILAGHAR